MVGEVGERPWHATRSTLKPRTVAQHQLCAVACVVFLHVLLIPIFYVCLLYLTEHFTIFRLLLPDTRAGHCRRPWSALGQSEVRQDDDGFVLLYSDYSQPRRGGVSCTGYICLIICFCLVSEPKRACGSSVTGRLKLVCQTAQ